LAKNGAIEPSPNRRNDLFQQLSEVYASAPSGALPYALKAPFSPVT